MSSAREVAEGLKRTGTAGKNLAAVERYLERHPGASGREMVEHFRHGRDAEPLSPVTLEKAAHIADGKDIEKIMGVPPKKSEGGLLRDLVDALTDKVRGKSEDALAEAQAQGIGAPKRPSAKA